MKLNTIRDTSIIHEMPQHYMEKLVGHIEKSKTQNERIE